MSREFDRVRETLYEVMDEEYRSLAGKRQRALELGVEYLGVENGHVERIDDEDGTHEVVASVGGGDDFFAPGETLEAATTYCRRTVESSSPLALSDAGEQGWAADPAYLEHGLDCYLGATVYVNGETYGTVCFVSRNARSADFAGDEKAFVELVARLLGREMESARHEEDLERSEQKYASLLAAAPDAVFLLDAPTWTVVEANEAAADLVGVDRDALVGSDVADLTPPGDDERYREELARFVEEDDTRERFADGSPLAVRRRDGTDVPVEISAGSVTLDGREYVQAIVRDVSERRDRQRELRVKNRAIDDASVGVTIADATTEDLPLVYANREFERVTGYDREAVLGRNCRFLQGPDTDGESIARINDALSACEPVTTDLLNYRADGTPFWNELTVTPVTGEDGDVSHFLGFQRDITARKRRERLVGVLNRVLRHNLRNDMNVVSGYADLLAAQCEGDAADAARRIADTADDLTALGEKARSVEAAMRNPPSPAPRDVVADVSAVAEEVRASHPDADVTVEAPGELRAVASEHLRMALSELGENAARHAGPAADVTLRVVAETDDRVAIRVADDGPGLGETEQEALRAGRETPLEHGDGLGLWLVNWLVTSVGGQVTADVDDGTTVSILLGRPDDRDAGPEPAGGYRRAAFATSAE